MSKDRLKASHSMIALVGGLSLYAVSAAGDDGDRWYSQEQAKRGAGMFARYCAGCHGNNAEGLPGWRAKAAVGREYPPPLDGSGTAWHTDLDKLRRIIRSSRAHVELEDKPADELIDETIAFFQSTWSSILYHAWMERTGEAGERRRALFSKDSQSPATAGLERMFPGEPIGDLQPTPVPRVFQVRVGARYVYVTRDGGHAFFGDLVDLTSGRNLTDSSRQSDVRAKVSAQ